MGFVKELLLESNPDDYRQRAEWLLVECPWLNKWETAFCENIAETKGELTEKQMSKLDEIYWDNEPFWHATQKDD